MAEQWFTWVKCESQHDRDWHLWDLFLAEQKTLTRHNVVLPPHQIQARFAYDGWFNCDIMVLYLKLLEEHSERHPEFPRSFFFTPNASSMIDRPDYSYKRMAGWFKNVSLLSYELLFFVVNVGGNHWVLFVAEWDRKLITAYDSLNHLTDRHPFFPHIVRYLVDRSSPRTKSVSRGKTKVVRMDEPEGLTADGWTFKVDLSSPQQDNGYDCGIFALQNARCLSERRRFNYSAQDVRGKHGLKQQMYFQLVNNSLEETEEKTIVLKPRIEKRHHKERQRLLGKNKKA